MVTSCSSLRDKFRGLVAARAWTNSGQFNIACRVPRTVTEYNARAFGACTKSPRLMTVAASSYPLSTFQALTEAVAARAGTGSGHSKMVLQRAEHHKFAACGAV
eukprot:3064385-Pleurochrysis_carterae.AAC.1